MSIACWVPAVTTICSGSARTPRAACRYSAMERRNSIKPRGSV
jgi:hypothetical protein